MTGPEQHAATVREMLTRLAANKVNLRREYADLDELVALASEAERLADSLRTELRARPPETDGRETYADGYTPGLIRALQIAAGAGA